VTALVGFRAKNHPQQGVTDSVDDRETDPVLFVELERRFGPFSIDVAAAGHNAKCERFYDLATDGLRQSWKGESVWCNPPYSNIEPWVAKAWAETENCHCIVMLLPNNRCEQRWWQRRVEPFRDVRGRLRSQFLPGRPRFLRPGQEAIGPNERPPFGLVLLVWKQRV